MPPDFPWEMHPQSIQDNCVYKPQLDGYIKLPSTTKKKPILKVLAKFETQRIKKQAIITRVKTIHNNNSL